MIATSKRNVRENNSPVPLSLNDDLAQIETEDFYGKSYLELSERAVKVNFLYEEFVGVVNKAVFIAIEMGKELEIIQNDAYKSGITFEKFLAEKCTKIKSSRAYDFIAFSKRPDLQELGLQSSGLLLPSHLIELLSAPSDVIEQVQEKVDAGEKVSVSEIKKYKQAAKKAEEDAAKARKDADEWRVSMQTQQAINQQNMDLIDKKVDEKLQEKAEKIEQAAISAASAEFQSTIEALQQTIANQRTQLITESKSERVKELNEQITLAEKELQALNVQKNQAAYEERMAKIAKQAVETAAAYRAELLATGTTSLGINKGTFNVLMDASEALQKLSQQFFDLANPDTLAIGE